MLDNNNKTHKIIWILSAILVISLVVNIRVISKQIKYERYLSNEIRNTFIPMINGILDSQDILEEIIETERISQVQYKILLNSYKDFTVGCGDLRYIINQVNPRDYEYFNRGIQLDIYYYLQMFGYEMNLHYGIIENIEFKELTNEELKKFKIIREVTGDYSDIFIKELGDTKTGEVTNNEGKSYYEYDINDEKWILVLQEIFKYNRESKYKDEF